MKGTRNSAFFVLCLMFVAACATTDEYTIETASRTCLAEVNAGRSLSFTPPYPPHETPVVIGDFDGNGTRDTLCIGMKPGSDTGWLFVLFRDHEDTSRIVSLEHFSPDTPVADIRVFREPANTFVTRCGTMPEECDANEPLQLDLKYDSIFLAVLDASGILIYLDPETGQFAREWLID